MNIKRLQAGIYAANCYIVASSDLSEAIVVDPGGDADMILSEINKLAAKVKGILLTHGHGDHIGGVMALNKSLGVPVMVHKADLEMVKSSELNFSSSMAMDEVIIEPDVLLTDGDEISIGNEKLLVIHTPGHTRGGICLYTLGHLITGDTLFKGSIGRTDLYGGDFDTIIRSIKNKLLRLPEDTIVYPGHGPESSIGFEKQRNPFLKNTKG
mgnify:CR=1 FL=1